VVSLHSPKERVWGELVEISNAGVTVRGYRFECLRRFRQPGVAFRKAKRIGLPTLFFPMLRIERIALDEVRGSIPSMADMFEKKSRAIAGGLSRAIRLKDFSAHLYPEEI